jgi:hypothetical protein
MCGRTKPFLFPIAAAVFVPLLTIGGGIWYVGGWVGRIEQRLEAIEIKTAGAIAHDARISNLETRVNWIDNEKKEDREVDRRLGQEIRTQLQRLNDSVIRLEENVLGKRRR